MIVETFLAASAKPSAAGKFEKWIDAVNEERFDFSAHHGIHQHLDIAIGIGQERGCRLDR